MVLRQIDLRITTLQLQEECQEMSYKEQIHKWWVMAILETKFHKKVLMPIQFRRTTCQNKILLTINWQLRMLLRI